MKVISAIWRFIVGIVFGLVTAFAISPALAAMPESNISQNLFFLVILAGGILAVLAPTARRAFGRGFLLSGAALVALPLSMALLSGRAFNEVVGSAAAGDQAFTAVGAGLGAAAVTGAAAFIGIILGMIFLIAGLVLSLGGRREVVIINGSKA